MKTLAIAVLLAVSIPVQAQMYKCVDEGGKARYSDKPIAGCKTQTKLAAPPPPAKGAPGARGSLPKGFAAPKASASAQAPAKRAAKAEPTEQEKAYFASRCKTLKEEEQWLLSPRGAVTEARDARLGQVRQALSACR